MPRKNATELQGREASKEGGHILEEFEKSDEAS